MVATICSAQVKYTYCDVYARGGWNNMNITIMHNNKVILQTKGNISFAINAMADQGWVLDESIVIPRQGLPVTRHKLHFIMKKEYVKEDKLLLPNVGNSTAKATESNSSNYVKAANSSIMDESYKDLPSELYSQKAFMEEGIKNDIKAATTEQDMLAIKKKIDMLRAYYDSLDNKSYDIVEKLSTLEYNYVRKAKKLGVAYSK
jgi:hypothetical protein